MIKYHSLAQVIVTQIIMIMKFMMIFLFRVCARSADVRLSFSWVMVSLNLHNSIINSTTYFTTQNTYLFARNTYVNDKCVP